MEPVRLWVLELALLSVRDASCTRWPPLSAFCGFQSLGQSKSNVKVSSHTGFKVPSLALDLLYTWPSFGTEAHDLRGVVLLKALPHP